VDRCGEFTTGMTVADFRSKSDSPKDVTVCMAAKSSDEIPRLVRGDLEASDEMIE